MSPIPTWRERLLASFERATEHRTLQCLKALAVYAREDHQDAYRAFQLDVQQIVSQDDVDVDLVLETAEDAWSATESHVPFRPITEHTTLDGTLDSTVDDTMHSVRSSRVRRRSLRVYRALLEHAREHGLPYHAIGVDLARLAERLGYMVKGTPDKARALGDVRAAEDDQILVRLDRGRQRAGEQTGLCALYCLRSANESLEQAAAHGMTQREYLKRKATVAGEPFHDAAPAPAVEPAAAHDRATVEEQVRQAEILMENVVPPYLLSNFRWRWGEGAITSFLASSDDPLEAFRVQLNREVQQRVPGGVPL